ncbi:hypothetical protein [Stenomitos frigidus]|nr:hypothetical protein [Stenomitos frigidus]
MSATVTANEINVNEIDWRPILNQLQRAEAQSLPTYPGDLKLDF